MTEIIERDSSIQSSCIPKPTEVKQGMGLGFLAANMLGVTMMTGLMAGAGAYMGSFYEGGDTENVRLLEQNLLAMQEGLEQNETLLLDLETQTSELNDTFSAQCVEIIREYVEDTKLSATPDDSVVEDLVTHPDAPCGAAPTTVRKSILTVKDIISRYEQQKNYPYGQVMENITSLKASIEDENTINDSEVGAWIVGVFGFMLGCYCSYIAYEENHR